MATRSDWANSLTTPMRGGLLALTLVALACRSAAAQSPAAPPAWDLWPYRVRILVAAAKDPELPPAAAAETSAQLAARSAAIIGGWWQASASPAPAELAAAMLADIASIDAQSLAGEAKDTDKVILLTIGRTADTRQLAARAREYDVLTGLWNAPVEVRVSTAAALAQASLRAMLLAFAPLARIETVSGDTATLTLRGGAIPLRDRELARVQSGAAFRPVLVASDARGGLTAQSARPLEWTYLIPQSASGATIRCRVQTALAAAPIPEYHPLRQRLALGVSASSRATQLSLVSGGAEPAPLEGYEVAVKAAAADGTVALRSIGRSDQRGKLLIAPSSQAVQTLVVRYGELPLLEVPLASGLATEATLPLPDVRGGAALEAALSELEDAAIDLLAKRAALEARRKSAAGNAALQDAVNQQLAALPKLDALAAKLQQHEQAIGAAQPLVRARLEAKAAALRQLLTPSAAAAPKSGAAN
jgi:hypothetical protein